MYHPGLLIGFGMMFVVSYYAKRDNLPVMERVSREEFFALAKILFQP